MSVPHHTRKISIYYGHFWWNLWKLWIKILSCYVSFSIRWWFTALTCWIVLAYEFHKRSKHIFLGEIDYSLEVKVTNDRLSPSTYVQVNDWMVSSLAHCVSHIHIYSSKATHGQEEANFVQFSLLRKSNIYYSAWPLVKIDILATGIRITYTSGILESRSNIVLVLYMGYRYDILMYVKLSKSTLRWSW